MTTDLPPVGALVKLTRKNDPEGVAQGRVKFADKSDFSVNVMDRWFFLNGWDVEVLSLPEPPVGTVLYIPAGQGGESQLWWRVENAWMYWDSNWTFLVYRDSERIQEEFGGEKPWAHPRAVVLKTGDSDE